MTFEHLDKMVEQAVEACLSLSKETPDVKQQLLIVAHRLSEARVFIAQAKESHEHPIRIVHEL